MNFQLAYFFGLREIAIFEFFVKLIKYSRKEFVVKRRITVIVGEEKNLYSHENIVNDDLTELAQRINLLYNNISNPPDWLRELKSNKDITAEGQERILNEKLADPRNREFMRERWTALPYIELR